MQNRRGIDSFAIMRRATAIVMLTSLLAGCATGGSGPGRNGSSAPLRMAAQAAELRQCMAKLSTLDVQYSRLPDQKFKGGCSAIGAVKLIDIGVPTTNLGAMTCGLASNFAAWARYGVQPAARIILGSEIVRINSFGTYNCRPIAGSSRLSEHGRSNAVDIASFEFADGRKISIAGGWNDKDEKVREFLRTVRTSACRRFRTVLSPDYNSAHHDHLHFDMGGKGGYCR